MVTAIVGLLLFRPKSQATPSAVLSMQDSSTTPVSVAEAPPPIVDSVPVTPTTVPLSDRARVDSVRLARAALVAKRDSAAARAKAAADSARAPTPAAPASPSPGALAAAFPEDAIRAAFAAGAPDYRAHTVRVGNARALFLSPPVLAWRARQASAWKQANLRPDVGIPYDIVDPIEVWSGWRSTLRTRRPVVVIEVLPNDAAFPRYAPAEALDIANGDVSSAQLLRNGAPVTSLQSDRIPALINTDGVAASGKAVANAIVFAVPADVFGADGTTTAGRLEVQVTAGGKRSKARIDDALVRRIADEFAPWRGAGAP
jgi:hypothetical protein